MIWLVAAGSVVVVAVIATVVVFSAKDSGHEATPSQKPDIVRLNDDMLIPQSDFPSPPGGEFRTIPVSFNEPETSKPDADSCDFEIRWLANGFQVAKRYVTYDRGMRYEVALFVTPSKPDVKAWAHECLPNKAVGAQLHDLPGFPSWAIATLSEDGEEIVAFGVYRGVLVNAFIREASSPADAKSALVSMFNEEITRLEAH